MSHETEALHNHLRKTEEVADTIIRIMQTDVEVFFSRKQGLKVFHETHQVITTGHSTDPERDTIILEVSQDGDDWVYTMQWDYLRGDYSDIRYSANRYQITSGLYKKVLTAMENCYSRQFKTF